jgi:ABC-2 type transport system permease protein
MKAILLREIKSFFGSTIGYLVIALFLILNGFSWFSRRIQHPEERVCRYDPFFLAYRLDPDFPYSGS